MVKKFNFKKDNIGVKATLIAYLKENEKPSEYDIAVAISKECNIDLNEWQIKACRITGNIWTVNGKFPIGDNTKMLQWDEATNSQVKVVIDYQRAVPDGMDALKKLKRNLPKFQFSHYEPKYNKEGDTCLEVAVLDAHIGKLAWLFETMYRNFDTNISLEDYKYAVDKILAWGNLFQPSVIEYILGQDFFHVDNMSSHTTGGDHTLDVDGRITKIMQKAAEIVMKNIYECRKLAPVNVRWVPGNHDFFASYALASMVKEHFKDDKFVNVDISHSSRKAVLWGNLLVGWTHQIKSRHNTWGNELAQAFPELWGKSKFREWHHGDQHKKQDVKLIPTFTSGGVLCRQLTALSPVDRWHFENVFTDAIPGGEGFMWSKDMGVFANLIAWTGQYEDHRNKLVTKD